MSKAASPAFSTQQILLPVALVGFVVFLGAAFQTMQGFRDRAFLHDVLSQQDKPLESAQKIDSQVKALAQGTLKLAQGGDKNAQVIVDNLKKAGISIETPKATSDGGPVLAPPGEHVAMPSKQP